jgi:hypothetical protein
VLGAAHRLRGAADAHNPDVARLTTELWQALGERLTASYDRGRSLGRTGAAALLDAELLRSG